MTISGSVLKNVIMAETCQMQYQWWIIKIVCLHTLIEMETTTLRELAELLHLTFYPVAIQCVLSQAWNRVSARQWLNNHGAVKGDYMKINHPSQKLKNSLITNDHNGIYLSAIILLSWDWIYNRLTTQGKLYTSPYLDLWGLSAGVAPVDFFGSLSSLAWSRASFASLCSWSSWSNGFDLPATLRLSDNAWD